MERFKHFTWSWALSVLIALVLSILALTACVSSAPAPTAAIQTRVPDLDGGTISTGDGVMSVQYPAGWSAETVGARIGLSSAPGVISKIGRETFTAGETAVDIAYVARAQVAAALGLAPDFTLAQLAQKTQNDLVEMTTQQLTINGAPAIGQTGEIALDAVLADIYAVTFERDGILITVTTYSGPGTLDDIRGVSTQIAESITLDTSKLTASDTDNDADAIEVTAEG